MASNWVGSRDATQIRTHVQKLKKDKLAPQIANLEALQGILANGQRKPSKEDSDTEEECLTTGPLSKDQTRYLNSLVVEYLHILVFSQARPEVIKRLRESSNFPKTIMETFESVDLSPNPRKAASIALKETYSTEEGCRTLIAELKRAL